MIYAGPESFVKAGLLTYLKLGHGSLIDSPQIVKLRLGTIDREARAKASGRCPQI